MIRYVAWQAATMVAVLIGAIALLVVLTEFIPGDAASVLLGSRATPASIAALRSEMGLDLPVYQRIAMFVFNAARGDLGTDVISGRDIASQVFAVVPNTLVLAFSAILLAALVGVPIGVHAAARPDGFFDRLTAYISVGLISTPSFVIGILLLLVFSVRLGWTPVLGGGEGQGLLARLHHLILPALAIACGWVGYIARQIRASLLDVLGQDYIRTARAYGLPNRTIRYRYALKIAIIPVLSVLGIGIGDIIGKSVFVEIIFNRPGIGSLINESLQNRNYPVVQAGVLVVVFLFVAINAAIDIVFAWLDPRIRERLFRAESA